jgi:hypothetical protein
MRNKKRKEKNWKENKSAIQLPPPRASCKINIVRISQYEYTAALPSRQKEKKKKRKKRENNSTSFQQFILVSPGNRVKSLRNALCIACSDGSY